MSTHYGVVEYYGNNLDGHPCGYCKGRKPDNSDYGKFKIGMWAHVLAPLNYQQLIDRGWRRSGKYCYKPILDKTCCPAYTIRCSALDFKPTKSQKKVIKRFNRFIVFDEKKKNYAKEKSFAVETEIMERLVVNNKLKSDFIKHKPKTQEFLETKLKLGRFESEKEISASSSDEKRKKNNGKAFRKERKLKKIMERENCDEEMARNLLNEELLKRNKVKTLEDRINETDLIQNKKHKFETRFVLTSLPEYDKTFEIEHKVYQKYQMTIHKDNPEECTKKQFKRFLVDTPLEAECIETAENLPKYFGSYHQQYWLDDQLIAVGVIDVLPNSVSSVYLLYDPQYDFLSLGTYSALREILLVRNLQNFIPDMKYYYMGYYIDSCPKMRYKGKFVPSYLLCPETYSWISIERCLPKLQLNKYSRFEDDPTKLDVDGKEISDDKIMVLHQRQVMNYAIFKRQKELTRSFDEQNDNEVREYASLVGRRCVGDILLYRE